ncbi:hypothetical protein HDU98_009650 [Podochytrium sp. JEL0797]|nr:hypothetical protein HDU98_009650 [Podochytrium sp. JEL0797]
MRLTSPWLIATLSAGLAAASANTLAIRSITSLTFTTGTESGASHTDVTGTLTHGDPWNLALQLDPESPFAGSAVAIKDFTVTNADQSVTVTVPGSCLTPAGAGHFEFAPVVVNTLKTSRLPESCPFGVGVFAAGVADAYTFAFNLEWNHPAGKKRAATSVSGSATFTVTITLNEPMSLDNCAIQCGYGSVTNIQASLPSLIQSLLLSIKQIAVTGTGTSQALSQQAINSLVQVPAPLTPNVVQPVAGPVFVPAKPNTSVVNIVVIIITSTQYTFGNLPTGPPSIQTFNDASSTTIQLATIASGVEITFALGGYIPNVWYALLLSTDSKTLSVSFYNGNEALGIVSFPVSSNSRKRQVGGGGFTLVLGTMQIVTANTPVSGGTSSTSAGGPVASSSSSSSTTVSASNAGTSATASSAGASATASSDAGSASSGVGSASLGSTASASSGVNSAVSSGAASGGSSGGSSTAAGSAGTGAGGGAGSGGSTGSTTLASILNSGAVGMGMVMASLTWVAWMFVGV